MKPREEKPGCVIRDRRDFMKAMTALPIAGLVAASPRALAGSVVDSSASAPDPGSYSYDPQDLNPFRPDNIPRLETAVPSHRYIWADLRAFDNKSPGFGAKGYLRNLGFKPSAICLLLSYPDFVFLHDNASPDQPLEHRFTVYGGTVLPSQSWNTSQLKGFIGAMHRSGVKVLASMFMLTSGDTSGGHDWFQKHPEVRTFKKDGSRLGSVNPLTHLNTGQLFEDVFLDHLIKCLPSFGFDGYHAADMSTHLSVPLDEADFSDDMVGQFLVYSKIELPAGYRRHCETSVNATRRRASWILKEKRAEWVAFWRYRWGAFWKKVASACKKKGLMVIANQPWTMPPYEAIYRYGFDYKVLEQAGIDALVVETVAGPTRLGGYTPEVNELESMWLEDATAMVACVKAYVPSLPLVFLLCVQDENEQWDTLRLAPAFLEKEIFSYVLTFYRNGAGGWNRCLDGFVVCLGVGLSREDWARVGETVSRAFACSEPTGIEPSGATAVWSDEVMETQLRHHLTQGAGWPRPPLHSYMRNLSHDGAPLRTIVRIENVERVSTPLFLVGGDLLDKTDRTHLKSWLAGERSRRLMTAGKEGSNLGVQVLAIRDYPEYGESVFEVVSGRKQDANNLQERLRNQLKLYDPSSSGEPLILNVEKETGPLFPVTHDEPGSFLEPLPYQPIYRGFISSAAKAMISMANLDVHSTQGVVFSFSHSEGRRFLMVLNDKPGYLWCRISVEGPIAKFKLLSSMYPRRPSIVDNHTFDLRVAPDGVAAMEMGSA